MKDLYAMIKESGRIITFESAENPLKIHLSLFILLICYSILFETSLPFLFLFFQLH